MANAAAAQLHALEQLQERFDARSTEEKLRLLSVVGDRRLENKSQLRRFHELLCFMRAYPDSSDLLRLVTELQRGFADRADLKSFSRHLVNSGIAGTRIESAFYWATANWLVRRWPQALSICWDYRFQNRDKLHGFLRLLLPDAEGTYLDECPWQPRSWMQTLSGPGDTDAAFLVRRFRKIPCNRDARRLMFEDLDVPMSLEPVADTPSRTTACYRAAPIVWQNSARSHKRPVLKHAVREPPLAIEHVRGVAARMLIDLAREAMLTRNRDLEAIAYANPDDVMLVDCGQGIQFAWMGALPEQRHILETVYVFLTLKNGVPIGYVQAAALFGSAEVNYNVFESFRGADAAYIYGRALATVHHLMHSDCFVIDPYQLGGDGNSEALTSGAWWFYYKLGFRPRDPDIRRLAQEEARLVREDRSHRTPRRVLKQLGEYEMYLFLERRRDDVLSIYPLDRVAMHVSGMLADRFGAERGRGIACCVSEAADILGAPGIDSMTRAERQAWERWAPYVLVLPGVRGWSKRDRTALASVITAKGAPCELDYLKLFDQHAPLKSALDALAYAPIDT